jgi:hypothetical protein
MSEPTCPLCFTVNLEALRRPGVVPVDLLCADHQQMIRDAFVESERLHPDGVCTDTCGCMSLEEFDT